MKIVSIANAKSHLSALIADAEAGQSVVITRRGKAVARLVPEPEAKDFGWSDLRNWVSASTAPSLTVAEMREQNML